MLKSSSTKYGRVAQILHWVSALLIILLIPMGFMMQNADEAIRLGLYRTHVVLGLVVLLLTLARVAWHWVDPSPDMPPGLTGWHARLYRAVHALLIALLLVLTLSGIALNITSGLGEVLFGGTAASLPASLGDYPARVVHGLTSRIYIALLLAHIFGVMSYQISNGDVLGRMGLSGWAARSESEV